jgi:adenylosuccinate synthase
VLQNKGLSTAGRIFISSRAHIVLNLHQLVDKWEEIALGSKSVGTTRKGIGPTYSSKASRNGLRIGELRLESWDLFEVRFRQLVLSYRQRFGDLLKEYDEDSELTQLKVKTSGNPLKDMTNK